MLRPVEPEHPAMTSGQLSGQALLESASVNHLWDGWVGKAFTEELCAPGRGPAGCA